MKVRVEMSEKEIRNAVVEALTHNLGRGVDAKDVVILVKSKQNYKSEWEVATFKAEFESSILDKNEPTEF